MKRFKTLLILAVIGLMTAVAQVPTPVLGVSFDENGIVLSGTDAANASHVTGVAKTGVGSTTTLLDPVTGKYVGYTNNSASTDKNKGGGAYFYVKYNADDAVGQAFANGGTYEVLFRLDGKQAATTNTSGTTSNNGTSKFFSSQQAGGWSMGYYTGGENGGVKFEYVTSNDGGETNTTTILRPGMETANITTEGFYHIIVTIDKSNEKMTMYINGTKLTPTENEQLGYDFLFPNIGTTRRETAMWFCLGGDPAAVDNPAANGTENSCRSGYVFANIYNAVLTDEQVAARYNDETVQYYTQVAEPPTTSDLLWDVQPQSGNTVTDESPYHKIDINGTLTTDYNTTYKRYEVVNESANKANNAYRFFHDDPAIKRILGNNMAIEVFCKPNGAPASEASPFGFIQASGGIGFNIQASGSQKFYYYCYGYKKTAGSAGALNLTITTSTPVTTDYTHYIFTVDRAGNISKLYINGVKDTEFSNSSDEYDATLQSHQYAYVTAQKFSFNGDASTNETNCDQPFDGNIVFGRIWGKTLTDADVTALYNQATGTSTDVTVGSSKLTTAIFPYAAIVPAGVKAYVVETINGAEANMVPYALPGEIIPYGTPVIIKGNAGTYTFNAADVSMVSPKAAPAVNLLVGSFASKKAKANQLYTLSTTLSEFDMADANDVVDPQKAWLPVQDAAVPTLTLTENITLTEEEGVTTLEKYTAGDEHTCSFTRQFQNGVASTVCLPFAITSITNGTLYAFTSIEEEAGEYVVRMTNVASTPTTANTPYLFMPSATGDVTFTGTMTVPATATPGSTSNGNWAFAGTYEYKTWDELPAGCTALYGFAANTQNTVSPGDFVKVKLSGNAFSPAFRAVMKYNSGASARSYKNGTPALPDKLKVVLDNGNGTLNAIGTMKLIQEGEKWYTVDGTELKAQPTKRGIYIRNGKKVFVK